MNKSNENQKPIVIAEVGCNHKGDMATAKELIKMAAIFCKVDIVKFQKRTLDKVYTKEELDKPREHPLSDNKTNRGQKEALEFNKIEFDEIDRYCDEIGTLMTLIVLIKADENMCESVKSASSVCYFFKIVP